jgi:hypothetical protein
MRTSIGALCFMLPMLCCPSTGRAAVADVRTIMTNGGADVGFNETFAGSVD